MSFLAPLFMLGAAAIALPVVFHLIRRTPRGRRTFSSLMFLSPSPPRLTRRSRLDNLLLLLLRALAILLLAAAFARPFLREAVDLSLDGVAGRRVVILLDNSASMRGVGVWSEALERVRSIVDQLEPADEVALYVFDTQVRPLIEFDAQRPADRASRNELFARALESLEPGWRATDLGTALVEMAELLAVAGDRQATDGRPPGDARAQIILISDLQQGASREALHAVEWPEEIYVALETVRGIATGNASLRLLDDETDQEAEPRIRITNTSDAKTEQFRVFWATTERRADPADEMVVQVPPGQSHVVRLPRPKNLPNADRVQLAGDRQDFDDTFFVPPAERETIDVVYVGDDSAEDPEGMQYFLAAALDQIPDAEVRLSAVASDDALVLGDGDRTRLIVAAAPSEGTRLEALKQYVANGGALLLVPASHEAALQLVSFNPAVDVLKPSDSDDPSDYVMLSEIDFSHPVFADFAPADYSDFTKIHFWKHVRFAFQEPASARVLARFDNGFPALWEQDFERGTVFVLASGWRLDDSQLALSSKFVPLLMGILEQARGGRKVLPSYEVGEPVPLPATGKRSSITVRRPDGAEIPLDADATMFREADLPGVYELMRFESAGPTAGKKASEKAGARLDENQDDEPAAAKTETDTEKDTEKDTETKTNADREASFAKANAALTANYGVQRFAVNLAAIESDTAPLDPQQLEAFGVRLGEQPTQSAEMDRRRQLRDIELESRQKLWQWLIVVVLVVLGMETWLASRRSSSRASRPGDGT